MSRLGRTLTLLTALLAACGTDSGPHVEVPLVDEGHAPDVLVETPFLETPPSLAPNRFVRGWGFERREGELWLKPRPGSAARLEAVFLERRPRDLILQTEVRKAAEGASVEVRAGGSTRRIPLASPLEVPLPAPANAGRVPVDLRFPDDAEVLIRAARFRDRRPSGEVEITDGEIRTSGRAMVDVVRYLEHDGELLGRFLPPPTGEDAARHEILVETGDGWRSLWSWGGGWLDRLRGARELALPLGAAPGLVRIRFVAEGGDGAAVWQDLRLRFPPPPPPPETRPPTPPRLVVLYVLDALRADYVGHLGGPEGVSPHLDRMAREGVTFENHLSVAPNTLPATRALFAGRIARTPKGLAAPGTATLAEAFAAAGYRTALFSDNPYVSSAWGLTAGFEHAGELHEVAGRDLELHRRSAEHVHRAALEWLDDLGPGDRAFLYLHTLHPHNPYDPPEEFRRRFVDAANPSAIGGDTPTLVALQRRRRTASPEDRARLRALYAGDLAYNDALLGDLLRVFEERFAPGEVLWIVTSDHGEELFDHGGVLHGYTLYREQLRIPLVWWWPRVLPAARVAAPTNTLDVHASLRALLGAPSESDGGRSLWPRLFGPAGEAGGTPPVRFAAAASVEGGIFMARSERYKLIWAPRRGAGWGMGQGLGRSRDPEYLFDLVRDPEELENLAGERSLEADWLRGRLRAFVREGKDRESGLRDEPAEVDDATREHLKALGYLE